MRFSRLSALRTSLKKRRKIVLPVAVATLIALMMSFATPSSSAELPTSIGEDYTCGYVGAAYSGEEGDRACDTSNDTRWLSVGYNTYPANPAELNVTFETPTILSGFEIVGSADDDLDSVKNRRVTGVRIFHCADNTFSGCTQIGGDIFWTLDSNASKKATYGNSTITPPDSIPRKFYKVAIIRTYGDNVNALNTDYACGTNRCMQFNSLKLFKKNYVTFNSNTGSGSMPNQMNTTTASLSANGFTAPTPDYTFAGWNTVANGSGDDWYGAGANYNFATNSGQTLYAQWMKLSATDNRAQEDRTFDSYTPTLEGTFTTGEFSASGLPTGLSINETTGEITGIPTDDGPFSVDVIYTSPASVATSVTVSISKIRFKDTADTLLSQGFHVQGQDYPMPAATADDSTSKFAGWNASKTLTTGFYNAASTFTSPTGDQTFYERRVNAPSASFTVAVAGGATTTISGEHKTVHMTNPQTARLTFTGAVSDAGTLTHVWNSGHVDPSERLTATPVPSNSDGTLDITWLTNRYLVQAINTLNGVSISTWSSHAAIAEHLPIAISSISDGAGTYQPADSQLAAQTVLASPTVNGGLAPYTFSISSGTLPAWATLNTTTGAITGKPTVVTTTSNLVIRATDANGAYEDSETFDLVISKKVLDTPATPTVTQVNQQQFYNQLKVSFSAVPGASSYIVQLFSNAAGTTKVKEDANFTPGGTNTFTGLVAATTYYAKVTAVGTGNYENSLGSELGSGTTNKDKFNITWDPQGGTLVGTPQAIFNFNGNNSSIAVPTNPTKAGYVFRGWGLTSGAVYTARKLDDTTFRAYSPEVKADLTLFAIWGELPTISTTYQVGSLTPVTTSQSNVTIFVPVGGTVTFNATGTVSGNGTLSYRYSGIASSSTNTYTYTNVSGWGGQIDLAVTNVDAFTGVTGVAAYQTIGIQIKTAPLISYPASSVTVGSAMTAIVPTVEYGTPDYVGFAIKSGTVPDGMTFSTSTGRFTGTPTTVGTSTLTVEVTDSIGSKRTSDPFTITVTPIARTLSLTSPSSTAAYQTSVQLNAPTSSPSGQGGAISYSAGSSTACTVNSTGLVSITSGTGTCSVTSTIAANGYYAAATSSAVSITVSKASQATLSMTLSATSSVYNGSAFSQLISATVSGGTTGGAVTLLASNNSATGCQLSTDTSPATLTATSAGTCYVTGRMAGDDNYSFVSTTMKVFTFLKKPLDTPATPTVVQLSNNQLKVNFTSVTNASSYIVQLYSDAAGTTLVNQFTGFTVGGANTFSGLTAATTYYAKVIAVPAVSSAIYANSLGSELGSGTTNKDSFNITWDMQGGTLTGSTPQATYSYTSAVISRPTTNPTKAGYQFKGWGRASNTIFDQMVLGTSDSSNTYYPTDRADFTLYAVWAEEPTMNITYQVGSSTPVTVSRTGQSIPISLVVGTPLSFDYTGTVSSGGTISYRHFWYVLSSGGSTNSFTRTLNSAGSWTLRVFATNTDSFTGTGGLEVSQDFEVRAVNPLSVSYTSASIAASSTLPALKPTTAGGLSGYSYAIKSGSVPAGLTFNTPNGWFTGNSTSPSSSTLTVEVTDSLGFKATSDPFTITVVPIARTLDLTTPSSTAAYLSTVQLNTPTQNPTNKGGAISYSAGSSTACSVNSTGLVSITSGTGTCAVTATIAANGNYAEATSSPVSITVSAATLATPSAPTVTPQDGIQLDVSWTAVDHASSYMVYLYLSSGTVLKGTQAVSTGTTTSFRIRDFTNMTWGTLYKVKVVAIGDGTNYLDSSDSPYTSASTKAEPVNPVATTQPQDATSAYGASASFSAVVEASDGGSLAYEWQLSTDGGNSWAAATSWTGYQTTSASFSNLTMAMNGYKFKLKMSNTKNGGTNTKYSSVVTLTVNKATPNIGGLSDRSMAFGSPSETFYLPSVLPSGGTWTLSTSDSSVATVSQSSTIQGSVSFGNVGTAVITASYTPRVADQTNYNNNAAATFTVTVTKAVPTLTSPGTVDKTYGDGAFTLPTPGSGLLDGTWTYATSNSTKVSLTGSTSAATTGNAGTSTITATFTPTDSQNYSTGTVTFNVVVAQKSLVINAAFNPNISTKVFGSSTALNLAWTPSGLVGTDSVESVTGRYTGTGSYNSATQPTNAGTYSVVGNALTFRSGSASNYSISYAAKSFTITQASQAGLVLSLSPTTSTSNGSSFSQLITASTSGGTTSGAVTLTVANGTATGCQISANTSPATVTATSAGTCQVIATMAGNTNYLDVSNSQALTFSKKALSVPANLQVSPVSGFTNRLSISFDASADATAYTIRYTANNWSTDTAITSYLAGQENILSGLTAGTTYKFKIYARQTTNPTYIEDASLLSGEVSATTHAATPTPTVTNASGTLAKTVGQSLTLTADVAAGTSLSYQWKKNGTVIAGATSASYTINSVLTTDAATYTCDITDTANGITSATATYTAETITVAKADPTIGTLADVTKSMGEASFNIMSASATPSGGTWAYSSGTHATATVTGTAVSIVHVGTSVITATYTPSDTANYNVVSTTFALTVNASTLAPPNAPTVTTPSSGTGLNASWVAVPGAISYVVRIYKEASTTELGPAKTITSGTTAQFMADYPTYYIENSKLYRITVQAIGDGVNYLDSAASSAGTATSVPPASIPTFTDIQSVSQPIGSTVEFTVNDAVSPDGGAITYYWYILNSAGNNVSWPTNVTGQRTKTLKFTGITMAQNGYRIQAVVSNEYLGNFRTQATSTVTLTVTKNTQTITFGSLASKDLASADFDVTATASSGASVTFTATTAATCSVTGSTVHIIAAGLCTIAADQGGTANYEAAPQIRKSFSISAASQTIIFGALSDRSYSATPFTVNATSSAGLTVAFDSATPSVCTVSGTSVTMVSTGDCTINADQAGDSTYAAATQVSRTFAITAASISAPSAPTLSATAGVLKSIEVSWSAITNSNGYLLKFYDNSENTLLAVIPVGSVTSTTIDTTDYASIADDTPYKVSIIAVGDTNYANSAESSKVGVTTNKSHTITYRSTGATSGNPPAVGSYITGAAASAIAQNTGTLARTGYTFAGWNTLEEGNGTNYTANGTGTYSTNQNVELHPVWTPNPVTVTFNSNFGTPTTTTQAFIADAAENLDANTFVNPGHTFIGWATSAQGQVGYTNGQSYTTLEPITFFAKWLAIDYSVEYRLNNGTGTAPTEDDQNIDDVITLKEPTGIIRTGYDFMGWSDGSNTYAVDATYVIGTTDVVFTAQWQIQTYTITYDVNSASGLPTRSTDTFVYGSNAIALPSVGTMTRTGYSFAGWSTALDGSSIVGNYTATASVTLYARWSPNTYTVTYNSNGAQGALAVETDSYTTASTVITLPGAGTMTRDGYTFGGWSETVAGSAIGTATYTTTTNRTLYAVWNAIDYTFTFTTAHGSTPDPFTKNIGDSFTLPTLTATGFYFAGWKVGSQTFDAGYSYLVETSDVAFTATWIQIFDVHYNFNGSKESAPADNPQLDGAVISAEAAPTRDGYNFAGWRAQNNHLIPAGANFTVGDNCFVLSATWVAINYPITYAAVGGTPQPSSTTKNYGESFTLASAPSKAGHSFIGWNDGTNTLGAGYSYRVQLAPVSLTAQWSAISYHVTYDINQGSSITPVMSDKTINQYFTLASAPVRFGYTFTGWSDGTNTYAAGTTYTVGAANATLTAQWSATALTMTYALNGPQGSLSSVIRYIGDVLVLEAAPTWADHTFLGWNDGTTIYNATANYLVTGSPVTFTARWENVLYGATYLAGGADGNAPIGMDLAKGTSFILPTQGQLAKTGYTFAGWSDGTTTYQVGNSYVMPSTGVTFTALWNQIPVVNPPTGNNGGSSGGSGTTPTTPVEKPAVKIVYGTSKTLAKAAEILGTPVTWVSENANCKVTSKGVVTPIAVGPCEIRAINKNTLAIANVFKLVVEPRLKISLKNVSKLKPTSARLNASVVYPGSDFTAKFCVTTTLISTDCKFLSSITVSNESSNITSKSAVSVTRDIQGLKPGTTYFVHAAVVVGTKQYQTAPQLLKTPKVKKPVVKPETEPEVTPGPSAPRDKPAHLWFTVDEPWFGRSI